MMRTLTPSFILVALTVAASLAGQLIWGDTVIWGS
jgi:hypothetical protein